MLDKQYLQTSSMRRERLWISFWSLCTRMSISTNIWVLFRWQTNRSFPPGAGTTLRGHLLIFSFLFGEGWQGFKSINTDSLSVGVEGGAEAVGDFFSSAGPNTHRRFFFYPVNIFHKYILLGVCFLHVM